MIKKTISYTDFDGNQKAEDFYFNLTKAELFKLEVTAEGNSLHEYLQKVVEANSGKKIIEVFELILKSAYGVRSEDGKRFMKSDQLFKEFQETEAYSEFFIELVTDADKAAKFVNGLIPAGLEGGAKTPEQMIAAKGGYNKPAQDNSVKKVEDIPTVGPYEAEAKDISALSREELEARLRQQNG